MPLALPSIPAKKNIYLHTEDININGLGKIPSKGTIHIPENSLSLKTPVTGKLTFPGRLPVREKFLSHEKFLSLEKISFMEKCLSLEKFSYLEKFLLTIKDKFFPM
jgi:hypothetical protein